MNLINSAVLLILIHGYLFMFLLVGPISQTHDNQDCTVSDNICLDVLTYLDHHAHVWVEQVSFRFTLEMFVSLVSLSNSF